MEPRSGSRTVRIVATLGVGLLAAACGSGQVASNKAPSGTITIDGIAFPEPEKTNIRLGINGLDVGDPAAYLIGYEHLDEKYGLRITQKSFSGTAQVSQAYVAGQIDVVDSGAVALPSMKTEKPGVMTYITSDKLDDILYGGKNVSTAADLRGKAVAVSSFGSQSYAGALLALKAMGLTQKDVTITPVGNDSARLAALKSGSVAASIQDYNLESRLKAEGFHVLVNLSNVDAVGYVTSGLTVPESFAKKYPNTTLLLTAMYQNVMTDFLNKQDVDAKAWAQHSGEPANQAAEDVHQQLALPQRPPDGRCKPEIFAFMKDVLSAKDDSLAAVDSAKACTNTFIDKLQEMGLQKKLGVPGY